MVIMEGTEVTYTKDQYYFLNTSPDVGGENNAFDYVVDGEETYDLEVNGTFNAYQVLMNNATTTVSATGKLFATGEALRIMGGTFTVEGSRAADAADPDQSKNEIFTGSWGGGTTAAGQTQISAGYFQINQEAAATISNTVLFVKAGVFAIDNATADISNTYMYLGSGGTYADIVVNFTNGAEVTFADNTKMINDAEFGMNITIDNTSSLTLDSSSLTATSVTNSGALKVTSGDDKASTVNVGTLTGVMEVAGGTLSASTVGSSNNTAGNVMFTGDAALDGANVLYGVNQGCKRRNSDGGRRGYRPLPVGGRRQLLRFRQHSGNQGRHNRHQRKGYGISGQRRCQRRGQRQCRRQRQCFDHRRGKR